MEGIVKFSDWQKLNLRVGQIKEIEKLENANKLYKIQVDLGNEMRIVVSGLVPYYTKEELKDKKIILFCNLEPRTIKGIESRGMILAAVTEDHSQVRLLKPDENIELGARIS